MKKLTIILLFFLTSCITIRVMHECECEEKKEVKRSNPTEYKPGAPGFWLVVPDHEQ